MVRVAIGASQASQAVRRSAEGPPDVRAVVGPLLTTDNEGKADVTLVGASASPAS